MGRKMALNDEKIRSMFTDEEWSEMLDIFRRSLNAGKHSPAIAYFLQRQIINLYAKHRLGNQAEVVFDVLNRELLERWR